MNIDLQSESAAPLLSDVTLARRLERTEAHANRSFVLSRAALAPAHGAAWTDVQGTWAMFDGVDSPLTQTFGLGMFTAPSEEQLATVESFFAERAAPVYHEVSPMADPSLLPLLAARGYAVVEWSTVLVQRLAAMPPTVANDDEQRVTVREIAADEADEWAALAARGWNAEPALTEFIRGLGRISATAHGNHCFVATLHGVPVATGSLHLHEGVALLAGASTLPEFRRRGAQRALLEARLRFARERGGDLAMMVTAPGSESQRNAQRAGFSVAYTRVKWGRQV